MNMVNGFISDQRPKTFQIQPKYQNLPKQINKDPYRSNTHQPTVNHKANKENLPPLLLQNKPQPLRKDQNQILIQKTIKNEDIMPSTKHKKDDNLRNIIDAHLFDNSSMKKKMNKQIYNNEDNMFNPPPSSSQNRYQIILRQLYGSPISNYNTNKCINNINTQNNKNKGKSSDSVKKCQSNKCLSKRSQVMSSNNKHHKSSQKMVNHLTDTYKPLQKDKKMVSYQSLHLNKRKLFL